MEQATFAELDHDSKRRRNRREIFLEKMDRLVPWKSLEKRVEPFYRRRAAVAGRIRCGRCCGCTACSCSTSKSDPGMEDLLYEVESVRRFGACG